MTIDLRDETGTHSELAARITTTLTTALPVIEDVTRLKIPSCTIRLVTPRTWRSEVRDYVERALERNFTESPPTPDEARLVGRTRRNWRARTRWRWPLLNGMTVTTRDGEPVTLVIPKALRHTGLDRTVLGLDRWVIHEAVHHAQIHASAGVVVPPRMTVRVDGLSDREAPDLAEGHAAWAELLVTYNLLGLTWPEPETRRTSLHTPVRLWLLNARNTANARRVQWFQHGSAPVRQSRAYRRAERSRNQPAIAGFDEARLFVERTILNTDRDLWNTLWTDLSLVPTRSELISPQEWMARVGL